MKKRKSGNGLLVFALLLIIGGGVLSFMGRGFDDGSADYESRCTEQVEGVVTNEVPHTGRIYTYVEDIPNQDVYRYYGDESRYDIRGDKVYTIEQYIYITYEVDGVEYEKQHNNSYIANEKGDVITITYDPNDPSFCYVGYSAPKKTNPYGMFGYLAIGMGGVLLYIAVQLRILRAVHNKLHRKNQDDAV